MGIAKHHLACSKLKCRYPVDSKASNRAYAKLHGITYSDIEKLATEFEGYDDDSIPVTHHFIHDD